MKKRDAVDAIRRAFAGKDLRRIRFASTEPESSASSSVPARDERAPEFEVAGWQFFALTSPFEGELDESGDAKLRTPDGAYIGLVWDATGESRYEFDFAPAFGPMLYVQVPKAVADWEELRSQLEPLIPLIEAEYRGHAKKDK
jgi:hypothetical protein